MMNNSGICMMIIKTITADLLWESYQDQFLTFCIRDIDLNKVTSEKLPFE